MFVDRGKHMFLQLSRERAYREETGAFILLVELLLRFPLYSAEERVYVLEGGEIAVKFCPAQTSFSEILG